MHAVETLRAYRFDLLFLMPGKGALEIKIAFFRI